MFLQKSARGKSAAPSFFSAVVALADKTVGVGVVGVFGVLGRLELDGMGRATIIGNAAAVTRLRSDNEAAIVADQLTGLRVWGLAIERLGDAVESAIRELEHLSPFTGGAAAMSALSSVSGSSVVEPSSVASSWASAQLVTPSASGPLHLQA